MFLLLSSLTHGRLSLVVLPLLIMSRWWHKKVKPSQRCPKYGKVHKEWAELSNPEHLCDEWGFEIPRGDQAWVMVMWNVAALMQPGARN